MTLRETYETLFPAPIARRMIEQTIYELDQPIDPNDTALEEMYQFLFVGRMPLVTDEPIEFWSALCGLYESTPTEEQIKEVFTKCNIPYE